MTSLVSAGRLVRNKILFGVDSSCSVKDNIVTVIMIIPYMDKFCLMLHNFSLPICIPLYCWKIHWKFNLMKLPLGSILKITFQFDGMLCRFL